MKIQRISLNEFERIEAGKLQIGDVVVTEHRHMKRKSIHEIDKVTKTMATCDCGNYVARYSIEINGIHTIPREKWDMLEYRVYRKKQ